MTLRVVHSRSNAMVSSISPKEVLSIAELRQRVKDIPEHFAEEALVRWLRAGKSDIRKAEYELRKSVTWRKKQGLDNVLWESFDTGMMEKFPYFVYGRDKLGHPIVEIPLGFWNLEEHAMQDQSALLPYLCQMLDFILATIEYRNKDKSNILDKITQFTVIIDLSDFRMCSSFGKDSSGIRKFSSLMERHYPDILYRGFLINCPRDFVKIEEQLRRSLKLSTFSRLSIFGSNKTEWQRKIFQLIDDKELSTRYGGKACPLAVNGFYPCCM